MLYQIFNKIITVEAWKIDTHKVDDAPACLSLIASRCVKNFRCFHADIRSSTRQHSSGLETAYSRCILMWAQGVERVGFKPPRQNIIFMKEHLRSDQVITTGEKTSRELTFQEKLRKGFKQSGVTPRGKKSFRTSWRFSVVHEE